MQGVQAREWRRYGFGGPPQPWEHDAQRDLDRLATSYYLEALEQQRRAMESTQDDEAVRCIQELFTTATRHKHEIDFTLRHWATPVERAPALASSSDAAEVRLKLEALQPTGSFKIRGAHNKLALLAAARAAGNEPSLPLITVSSGNHGIAVAHAARRYGMTVTILTG